ISLSKSELNLALENAKKALKILDIQLYDCLSHEIIIVTTQAEVVEIEDCRQIG
ncbi:MAG: hypothetical protein RLZZ490_376, partial [Cyanobacteriota bacterium]